MTRDARFTDFPSKIFVTEPDEPLSHEAATRAFRGEGGREGRSKGHWRRDEGKRRVHRDEGIEGRKEEGKEGLMRGGVKDESKE